MEMRYVCAMCAKSSTNPTTIDWCAECCRLVCRDCQEEHQHKHHAHRETPAG